MNEQEFDEFYAGSFPRLVGQLYAMTGSFAEAQDCVQEAFVRAWQHRKELAVVASPEAWVRTCAWRLAVSRWRRAKLAIRARDRSLNHPEPAVPGVDRPALTGALRQISADQRRAIVLHHICDLSVAEVAADTGVPVGTVKARLSRGRAALQTLLRDDVQEEEESRHD